MNNIDFEQYPVYYRGELITDPAQLRLLLRNQDLQVKLHTKHKTLKTRRGKVKYDYKIEHIELSD